MNRALEVVFPRLGNLVSFNGNVIHQQLLAFGKLTQIKAQRCDVGPQLLLGLFEVHADAGLAVSKSAVHQKFHRQ